LEYRNQDYPTMSITIAQQQITNGTVTMNVFRMASPQIWVSGSRYVSSGNQAQAGSNLSAAEPALPPMAPATFAATTNAVPLATSHPTVAADPEALARARAALFQKLAELGVDRVVPLRTARSVVRWEGERGVKQVERLRRVAREASAQSRRVWLPEVSGVCRLEALGGIAGDAAVEVVEFDRSPFTEMTRGRDISIDLDRPVAFELDGGARKSRRALHATIQPGAITVAVPGLASHEKSNVAGSAVFTGTTGGVRTTILCSPGTGGFQEV